MQYTYTLYAVISSHILSLTPRSPCRNSATFGFLSSHFHFLLKPTSCSILAMKSSSCRSNLSACSSWHCNAGTKVEFSSERNTLNCAVRAWSSTTVRSDISLLIARIAPEVVFHVCVNLFSFRLSSHESFTKLPRVAMIVIGSITGIYGLSIDQTKEKRTVWRLLGACCNQQVRPLN